MTEHEPHLELADHRKVEVEAMTFELITYRNTETGQHTLTVISPHEMEIHYEEAFNSVEEAISTIEGDISVQGARGFSLGSNVYTFPHAGS